MSDRAFNSATRSRLRGAGAFRRLLKSLPQTVHDEFAEILDDAGDELLAAMQAEVPVRTGKLRAGLKKQLLRASLRLRVGLLGTKRGRASLFYGRIVEFGRKAQTVNVTRRGAPYKMRVRAMAARPFVLKRRDALRTSINSRIRTFWDRVLADAAGGVDFE